MTQGKHAAHAPNESPDNKPLSGRTVLITRARSQAAEFAAELERLGARVVECPTIEIVEPESFAPLDDAIEHLFGYDWLIFTSVNGVDFFLRRLDAKGVDLAELDALHVCAVGEATAERLHEAHVHIDVIPEKFQAEGVFEALEIYLGGRANMELVNFLLPRAAAARDFLPKSLEEAGARADVVPAYRTVRPETNSRAHIEALLVGGGIDCVSFASSSAIKNFAQMFDTMDLSGILDGVVVACIGEVTSRTASEHGLETHVLPGEATTTALARAIADYYSKVS